MENLEYKKLLAELTGKTSVSGYEYKFSKFLKNEISKYCNNIEIDYFSNVIATFNSGLNLKKKKIMLTAHIDEIGLMVKSIDKNGFIKFTNIGEVDPKILLSQEVKIHGKRELLGVIGSIPPHLIENYNKHNVVDIDKLYIDTGFSKYELDEIISIGDVISFNVELISLNSNYISSKALDNRAGICTLIGVMNELKKFKYYNETTFNFTSMEETASAGVINSSYRIEPDLAIVIDTCFGKVQGGANEDTFVLGNGPVISIGPNFNSDYSKQIIKIARDEKISHQIDVEPGNSGTEAWATQISRNGIPTLLISIPIKYMHTPIEVMNIDDINLSVKLITNFLMKQ
ncbi:MAG: M42 family peptidase [Clostridiales bacterium]